MDYDRLFATVFKHVRGQGVKCEAWCNDPAKEQEVVEGEAAMKRSLPYELRQFYLSFADGMSLRWTADEEDLEQPFANFQVPTVSYLAEMNVGGRGIRLYSQEEAERYGSPHTTDPVLALKTAARQWHWLPVLEEGNGDVICMDLAEPGAPVVFHQHDWCDVGPGEDGHRLGESWEDFLIAWSCVCFQLPKSLWWPSTFKKGGGVEWGGAEFRDPFRIARI
jgi:cell wall assembly regulator SMI1